MSKKIAFVSVILFMCIILIYKKPWDGIILIIVPVSHMKKLKCNEWLVQCFPLNIFVAKTPRPLYSLRGVLTKYTASPSHIHVHINSLILGYWCNYLVMRSMHKERNELQYIVVITVMLVAVGQQTWTWI